MDNIFKKIGCVLLCTMFLMLSACNKTPDLYEKGIEITTIIGEMVNSEDYAQVMGLDANDKIELVKAKDYDTPTRVYKISVPVVDAYFEHLRTHAKNWDKSPYDKLSDNLKEQIKNRYSFLTIVDHLNSIYNWDGLVLSSAFMAYKKFDGNISSSTVYLYTFETGTPIIVLFEPFGDKQFTAKGHFVFAEDLSSLSKVRDVFEQFECSVENIK